MPNETQNQELHQPEKQPAKKNELSRRQFLSYTLGGTGGFLAASMMMPMVRFAIAPWLEAKGGAKYVKVASVSDINTTPKHFDFKRSVVDGWRTFEQELGVFIAKDKQGDIYALSDICTHLGCIVNWGTDSQHPDQFACPCHGSHFDRYGKNLVVAPIPLNQFDQKIQNGYIYLGEIHPNTEVKKEEG